MIPFNQIEPIEKSRLRFSFVCIIGALILFFAYIFLLFSFKSNNIGLLIMGLLFLFFGVFFWNKV